MLRTVSVKSERVVRRPGDIRRRIVLNTEQRVIFGYNCGGGSEANKVVVRRLEGKTRR